MPVSVSVPSSCVICGDALFGTSVVALSCTPTRQHQFHLQCIISWFCALRARNATATCPICRTMSRGKDDLPCISWKARSIKTIKPHKDLEAEIEKTIETEVEIKTKTESEPFPPRLQLCEPGAEHTAAELSVNDHELLVAFEMAVAVVRQVSRRVLKGFGYRSRALVGVMRPRLCSPFLDSLDTLDCLNDLVDIQDVESVAETARRLSLSSSSHLSFAARAIVSDAAAEGRTSISPWQNDRSNPHGALRTELCAQRDALAIATSVKVGVEKTEMLYALNIAHQRIREQSIRTQSGLNTLAEAAAEACVVHELHANALGTRENSRLVVLLQKAAVQVLQQAFTCSASANTCASACVDVQSSVADVGMDGSAIGSSIGSSVGSLCAGAETETETETETKTKTKPVPRACAEASAEAETEPRARKKEPEMQHEMHKEQEATGDMHVFDPTFHLSALSSTPNSSTFSLTQSSTLCGCKRQRSGSA